MNRRDFLWQAGSASLTLPLLRTANAAPCPPPTVAATGGTSANTGCGSGGTPPQYMAGMQDFEVRHLNTVTGGHVTMYSTLPSEWRTTGQPNGADMVFTAWSGGAADVAGLRLFVHGGGHFDSSNNGLYVYDFSGASAPVGWSIATDSLSALGAVTQSSNTYSDGKPTAIHSYNGLWYDPVLDRFYRVGGSGFGPGGAGISTGFYYGFAQRGWSSLVNNSNIGATLGSTLVGAPDGSKILYLSSTRTPVFITSGGSATLSGSAITGSEQSGMCAALDSSRSNLGTGVCRYVLFGYESAGPRAKIVTVNWPANSFTVTNQSMSGANAGDLNAPGACVAYDETSDCFWVFANDDDAADGSITHIYQVNAASFAVTRFALRSAIPATSNNRGGYNRHIWFPNWRIIGTVHAHDAPMSLIKLP